ncbi:MAG: LysR family transcriptional regulator, partial [Halofilum sp. (in: g-proteobacteria)]|nr:LysR family transcriptional regulator [Halofilum sp. (in: g-proteobacteria)]
LVEVGLGWSALPRTMLAGNLAPLEVPGIALQRDLGLVLRLGRSLGNAASAFVGIAREHA